MVFAVAFPKNKYLLLVQDCSTTTKCGREPRQRDPTATLYVSIRIKENRTRSSRLNCFYFSIYLERITQTATEGRGPSCRRPGLRSSAAAGLRPGPHSRPRGAAARGLRGHRRGRQAVAGCKRPRPAAFVPPRGSPRRRGERSGQPRAPRQRRARRRGGQGRAGSRGARRARREAALQGAAGQARSGARPS